MVGYWQCLGFGDFVADVNGPRTDQGVPDFSTLLSCRLSDGTRACPLSVQKATNFGAAGLVAKCQKATSRAC